MLQKIGFQPGINKQITPTGAEGQWTMLDLDMAHLKK
jgi:hypothetical protein